MVDRSAAEDLWAVPDSSVPPWHCKTCTCCVDGYEAYCTECGTPKGKLGLKLLQPPGIRQQSDVTGIGFDRRMMAHREINGSGEMHPERPLRIHAIYQQLDYAGVLSRCVCVKPRHIRREELESVHSAAHCDALERYFDEEYRHIGGDTYVCPESREAAALSAGIVVQLTEQVVSGRCSNAFAIVRPPGHHAEQGGDGITGHHGCMGFCLYNNVAVAAKVARDNLGVARVLVVDWDVHHGNGTQNMFYEDGSIMYCSLHRFEDGFYPGTGSLGEVGRGDGEGYNINIPWPEGGVGDSEYMAAFQHVLMPIFQSFSPELVLVSAGFDSAAGDPLGGCELSAAGYSYMTQQLMSLAAGKLVVALEGGYNLRSIAQASEACVRTLLGERGRHVKFPLPPPMPGAMRVISAAQARFSQYWPLLRLPGRRKRSRARECDDSSVASSSSASASDRSAAANTASESSDSESSDSSGNSDRVSSTGGGSGGSGGSCSASDSSSDSSDSGTSGIAGGGGDQGAGARVFQGRGTRRWQAGRHLAKSTREECDSAINGEGHATRWGGRKTFMLQRWFTAPGAAAASSSSEAETRHRRKRKAHDTAAVVAAAPAPFSPRQQDFPPFAPLSPPADPWSSAVGLLSGDEAEAVDETLLSPLSATHGSPDMFSVRH